MEDAIFKTKRLKLDELERKSPLGKWFYEMVQKSVDELTLGDVSRMLRQEVYPDIAIPLACTKLLEDPLCGEMYAGEMIEELTKVFVNNPNEKNKDFYTLFVKEVQQKWGTFEWADDYEKEEYKKSLFQLSLLFEESADTTLLSTIEKYYDNLYCKMSIDTGLIYEELFALILKFVGGKMQAASYISALWCDISVQKNKEYNPEHYLLHPDDFLYWKYYLDIEPNGIEEKLYIKNISDLLEYIKANCNNAIAACDFEDELSPKPKLKPNQYWHWEDDGIPAKNLKLGGLMMWKNIYVEGAVGSENGLILEDEAYANSCRITVEKCQDCFTITCGVYGAMVHTVFCGENYKEIYDAMKKELQEFIDKDTTADEQYKFYKDFTSKF